MVSMRALREHQHEISDLYGENAILFGTEETGYLTLERPLIVAGDQKNNDVDRPQEDGRAFGRDYRGGKSLQFTMSVLTDHLATPDSDAHRTNLDYLNVLEAFWTDEEWRENPWSFAMLRSCEAGRTWRCYGRPRKYDETAGKLTKSGHTPVVATFDLIDDKWYSDDLHSLEVSITPATEGGLVTPLKAPLTTTAPEIVRGTVEVGGFTATWPIVEFYGPIVNPSVSIGGLVIGLDDVTIADGDIITYDPRPWIRSVTRASDGAGFGGYLSAVTVPMRLAKLKPGHHETVFRGTDPSGQARVVVSWRDARTRP